jgi:hypothetical protein
LGCNRGHCKAEAGAFYYGNSALKSPTIQDFFTNLKSIRQQASLSPVSLQILFEVFSFNLLALAAVSHVMHDTRKHGSRPWAAAPLAAGSRRRERATATFLSLGCLRSFYEFDISQHNVALPFLSSVCFCPLPACRLLLPPIHPPSCFNATQILQIELVGAFGCFRVDNERYIQRCTCSGHLDDGPTRRGSLWPCSCVFWQLRHLRWRHSAG